MKNRMHGLVPIVFAEFRMCFGMEGPCQGHGHFTWVDGRSYEGEYKNDQKDGEGTPRPQLDFASEGASCDAHRLYPSRCSDLTGPMDGSTRDSGGGPKLSCSPYFSGSFVLSEPGVPVKARKEGKQHGVGIYVMTLACRGPAWRGTQRIGTECFFMSLSG